MSTRREQTLWQYKLQDQMGPGLAKLQASTDRLGRKMRQVEDTTNQSFSRMSGGLNRFSASHTKMVKGLSSEIPMLGRLSGLLTNPYVLAASAVASLGMVLVKAIGHAEEFNNQFLELKNLNLDKTQGQIQELNDTILDLSFEKGLDPTATAKAFYDIQSATGKYGDEVEQITGRLGEFAIATKTDFDALVNGVTKGMRAFKFGVEEVDSFLQSSAKTVQMGITTFDQLAQVQTEYAGSAAALGQSFDTANKLFSAFTVVAKDTNIAANQTKTAFQGLGDPKVQEGLKKWNINLFDAHGKMLDTTEVIEQLNSKIKTMSDQKFSQFMGDVGGPEGMRAMLNTIRGQGDELVATFAQFDRTEFSIDKAMENAKGDLKVMKTILNNQIKTGMVELGQIFIPPIVKGLSMMSEWLKQIRDWWKGVNKEGSALQSIFAAIKPLLKLAFVWSNFFQITLVKIIQKVVEWASKSELVKDIAWALKQAFEAAFDAVVWFGEQLEWLWNNTLGPLLNGIERVYLLIKGGSSSGTKSTRQQLMDLGSQYLKNEGIDPKEFFLKHQDQQSKIEGLINAGKTKEAKDLLLKMVADDKASKLKQTGTGNEQLDGGLSQSLSDNVTKTTDGGKSVKHITITIQQLVGEINNMVTNVKEGMNNSVDIVTEALVKTVHDAEITLGSN